MAGLRFPRLKGACCGSVSLRAATRTVGIVHLVLSALPLVLAERHGIQFYKPGSPTVTMDFSIFFRDEMMMSYTFTLIISAVFLLLGLKKNKMEWLEPFLVLKGSEVIYEAFSLGLALIARAFQYKSTFIFFQIASLAIQCYMFTIVHSCHEEMHGTPSNIRQET